MTVVHLAVICSLIVCVWAKSFTLVIDTTYSMQEELGMIQRQIRGLVNSIGYTTSIENYVVVPFSDPDVGPVQTFTKADSFIESIAALTVSGGHDIPENSLSGLEKALRESKPESDVFLFTDACAKDESKFSDIQRLCRITRSKVFVFMSGTCPAGNNVGNEETYHQVAKVCFGNVYHLQLFKYEQAFKFIKEVIKDGYNDVAIYESFSNYRQSLEIPVNALTKGVIVSVNGKQPLLRLTDESGHSPRTEPLIETNKTQVVRIVDPHRGLIRAAIWCVGEASVTIYSRTEFPLDIGFSPLYPNGIEATTSSPLPGRESFIYVLVPKTYEYKLGTMTIHILNSDKQKSLNLMEVSSRVYISQAYFEPGSIFRMTVHGVDSATSDPVQLISKTLEPQREVMNIPWTAAVIETIIPESSLIDYKKNGRIACKVTGYPQPTISWESEAKEVFVHQDSLLLYPATYISYVEVINLIENKTISCSARTEMGSDSRSTQVYVYRPYVFEMIKQPQDTVIEYETEGKLYCEVNSYPEAKIKWYHNDKFIQFTTNEANDDDFSHFADFSHSDEIEYFLEDNALVIRNMTSQYVGTYTCDVRNNANAVSFPVKVTISGLEPPRLDMSETQLTSKMGEGVKIECRVTRGRPYPTVTWKYKSLDSYDFTNIPDDIELEEGNIKIGEVMAKHKGVYKCEASNEQGQDTREVELRVIYAPKIENAETSTKNIELDEFIALECFVDAEPKATVKWERTDGVYFPDENHTVDGNTLKFTAQHNDSGTYRCIAENEAGTAEKITIVNVNVRPYITPVVRIINVRAGSTVTLTCRVEEADPPPTIKWEFIRRDSAPELLFEGNSTYISEHIMQRVTRAQSGKYRCLAENHIGYDVIEITVNVQ